MNAQIIVVADTSEKLYEVDRVFYEITRGDSSHLSEIVDLLKNAGFIFSNLSFQEIAARFPMKREW